MNQGNEKVEENFHKIVLSVITSSTFTIRDKVIKVMVQKIEGEEIRKKKSSLCTNY